MNITFGPNPQVGAMFADFSSECVKLAEFNFGTALDVSQESMREVERMAGMFHDQVNEAPPESVLEVARMLGGHVAHVLIELHGWTPGMVTMGGERMPGVQCDGSDTCWPWGKAHNRIVNGPEDNLWFYYLSLTDQLGPPVDPESLDGDV